MSSRKHLTFSSSIYDGLFWPLLFATFAFGALYSLFGWWNGVKESVLYMSMADTYRPLPEIWGAVAAVVSLVAFYYAIKGRLVPRLVGVVGFLVWVYAGFIYLDNDVYANVASVATPNMYFWAWVYLRSSLPRRRDAISHGDTEV